LTGEELLTSEFLAPTHDALAQTSMFTEKIELEKTAKKMSQMVNTRDTFEANDRDKSGTHRPVTPLKNSSNNPIPFGTISIILIP
jgi:hypothetical protein